MQSSFFPFTQAQWSTRALHWLSPDLPALRTLLNLSSDPFPSLSSLPSSLSSSPNLALSNSSFLQTSKKTPSVSGLPLGSTLVLSGEDEMILRSLAWTWVQPALESKIFFPFTENQNSSLNRTSGVFWLNLRRDQHLERFHPHFHSPYQLQSLNLNTHPLWHYHTSSSSPLNSPLYSDLSNYFSSRYASLLSWLTSLKPFSSIDSHSPLPQPSNPSRRTVLSSSSCEDPSVFLITQALQHPYFSHVFVEIDPFNSFSKRSFTLLHQYALIFKTFLVFIYPFELSQATLIPLFKFYPHLHLNLSSLFDPQFLEVQIRSDFFRRQGSIRLNLSFTL